MVLSRRSSASPRSSKMPLFRKVRSAVNRIKAGFFSLTHRSSSGDDRPYLGWHQLDHMPEQYQLPGMVLGQRWASTQACRSARAAEVDGWSRVEHVVCYLMGEPLDQTLDDFFALGRTLAAMGRFSDRMPTQYAAALRLLECHAAPRVLISAEVVPFRPHSGIYLIVEEPVDPAQWDTYLRRSHSELLPQLTAVDGVAGLLVFGMAPSLRRTACTPGEHRITLCYLDREPAEVGAELAPLLRNAWAGAPSRTVLAAPFESMMRWDWERFEPAPVEI